MSPQQSWRPNLPESQLLNEKTLLQGVILAAVAYGANLALFILIISLLITRLKVDIEHNGKASRLTTCLMTYVCVIFILSTLSVAFQAELTQLSFIENRDIPGGPADYEQLLSSPIHRIADSCFALMNWLSDSLLLWRCWVIYEACSVIYGSSTTYVWLAMVIPGLLLLASFVSGTILLVNIPRASSSSDKFRLTCAIVTLSLNIILTLMIVIRLYLYRRRLTKLWGRRHAAHYTSIIAMLIESAAIMTIMLLWFLIPAAMGNHLSNIPLISMAQIQVAASYTIIFRVANGTAWTTRTGAYEFTISDIPDHVEGLSNVRFQTASVEDSADHPARKLDEPRGVLDTESNGRGTVYEGSPSDPVGVIEKDNASRGMTRTAS